MKFEHDCPDWDFMTIDETCGELVGCNCFIDDPEFRKIKEMHCKKLDEWNYKTVKFKFEFTLEEMDIISLCISGYLNSHGDIEHQHLYEKVNGMIKEPFKEI